MQENETLLISEQRMRQVLLDILVKINVPIDKAKMCADVFTSNSLEGVYSHGINRFHRFVKAINSRVVRAEAEAVCMEKYGAIEQWNGNAGIGITNALICTDRAMELASSHGMGCVALSRTNHWMRAGTYSRRATSNGFVLIAWSNTIGNTPAWGAIDPRLGNNPLTIGVPFEDSPIVLDMAMSQFSYGALERYSMNNEELPVPGGFTTDGKLSTDAKEIIESRRTMPLGYWKGSGLSLVLDILVTILAAGLSVHEISKHQETNVSQVFIAINIKSLKNFSSMRQSIEQIINDLKQSKTEQEGARVRYPGEDTSLTRLKNMESGIPVSKKVWSEILQLGN
jgi:3-dehydro-L-gulonate 2-dehydrogenase